MLVLLPSTTPLQLQLTPPPPSSSSLDQKQDIVVCRDLGAVKEKLEAEWELVKFMFYFNSFLFLFALLMFYLFFSYFYLIFLFLVSICSLISFCSGEVHGPGGEHWAEGEAGGAGGRHHWSAGRRSWEDLEKIVRRSWEDLAKIMARYIAVNNSFRRGRRPPMKSCSCSTSSWSGLRADWRRWVVRHFGGCAVDRQSFCYLGTSWGPQATCSWNIQFRELDYWAELSVLS